MLNSQQKILIKTYLENGPFAFISDLKNSENQIKAYKSALSLREYVRNEQELIALDIAEIVRELGELLTHPAPQNPAETTSLLDKNTCFSPFLIAIMTNNTIKVVPKGKLNLVVLNDNVLPAEIRSYIEDLINEKISALEFSINTNQNSDNKIQTETLTRTVNLSTAKSDVSSKDIEKNIPFEQKSIPEQLSILGLNEQTCPEITEHDLALYQSFFRSLNITDSYQTLEEANTAISNLLDKIINHLNFARAYADDHSAIVFADIVEAMKKLFSYHLSRDTSHFHTYKALQIVALNYSDLPTNENIENEYIIGMLASNGNSERLKVALNKKVSIEWPHANWIFKNFIAQMSSYSLTKDQNDIFMLLLKQLPITPEFIAGTIIPQVTTKITSRNVIDMTVSYYILTTLMRSLLICNSASSLITFPQSLYSTIFYLATKKNDFELQMMALLHAPADTTAKKAFLNSFSFFELINQRHYAAAIKMATVGIGIYLTLSDIEKAESLSKGEIKFTGTLKSILNGNFSFQTEEARQILEPDYQLERFNALVVQFQNFNVNASQQQQRATETTPVIPQSAYPRQD